MEERQRGREGKREREREREREGGPPNGLWCPWVSMARLVLPLVPWLESAVHTGAQTQTQTMVQTQAHWVHMHIGRTDTGTYAQSTYACRCSVVMVKLEVVHFIGRGISRDSAYTQVGKGAVMVIGTDMGTSTGTSTCSSSGTGTGIHTRTRTSRLPGFNPYELYYFY